MDEYWHTISTKHQDKVRSLARRHEVAIDRAFRNIVRHLEWETKQAVGASYFDGFITARHIEGMIDLIAR